jgi:pimeloyl-ACP methyl ester carboxylesterase
MTDTDRASTTDDMLDRQLSAALRVEPSPAFLARVRSRVAGETMRTSWQTYGRERRGTMVTIARNGITLAYDDRGAGDPIIVFVHGWTCDRSFFAPQAEHFAKRHRVVSVDLRGHGESDKPHGPYPIGAYADDIAYLIDQLDLGKVVAVGHSMGGLAVVQLAASHPHCVAAIVMVEPGPFAPSPDLRAGFEAIADAIEAGNQEPRRELIRNHLFLPTSDPMFVEDVSRIMMAAPSHVAASALRGILAFDGPAVAAHCKVPTLHLAAASPWNPPHLMSQWLPNVVHGQTVGAGHLNQLEVPDQVNLMIDNFMRHYVFAPATAGAA